MARVRVRIRIMVRVRARVVVWVRVTCTSSAFMLLKYDVRVAISSPVWTWSNLEAMVASVASTVVTSSVRTPVRFGVGT
jgi:hypothetical protein